MYPETDIPIRSLDEEHWESISSNLPLTRLERIERLQSYDVSDNQIEAIIGGELDDILVAAADGSQFGTPSFSAKSMASALLDNTRNEIAEGIERDETEVPWSVLTISLYACENGIITREGIVPMARIFLSEGPSSLEISFKDRLEWFEKRANDEGFTPADNSAIEEAVDAILIDRSEFVSERGMGAIGPLMGMVMAKLGGAADGKAVSQILKEKITKIMEE